MDSINKTKDLIKTAVDLGYKGIAITDHECLSSHVEALKTVKELKKKNEMSEDFKLILGNEIYLVNKIEDVRDNYQKGGVTKFPHFILLACDKEGHRQLRELSSIAWSQSFVTGFMERVPTEKHILAEIVGKNKGHLIATTACLGSELAINTLKLIEAEKENNIEEIKKIKNEIDVFITWCIEVFGKTKFFVELQPALSIEQIIFNNRAVKIAAHYGLKTIVATDAHFLRPEDLKIHKAYLNSKDGDRETESFYEACFVQTTDEIIERLGVDDNLTMEQIEEAIANTMLIGEMVEDYDLYQPVSIPRITLPDFNVRHMFKPAYAKFEYISKMANSDEQQDQYLIKLIEDGFDEKVPRNTLSREYFYKILERINVELEELWHISLSLKESMSAYYITIREIINIMWDDCGGNSIVGAGRGSAAGFYINYLLDITQVDPMKYNLPHWRHLHKSRPDFPDIDLDTEASKRRQIINALKTNFGERKVLNIATFGTEKSKSAVLTSCRGLNIDNDIAMHIASLIPFERGSNWSLSDCLYGNEEENREPVKEFITEIEKYEGLKETALKIENVENKRSIHAGGVFIYNEDFIERNAMMKAPNGQWISQFTMGDSEYMGGIKYDLLTVEATDKIRETLNLLVEFKEITWQGSLKKTYNKYIHPDVLDYDNPEIWERMGKGEIIDLFQFNTQIGLETAKKVKPVNVLEASVANSLMRLMADGGSIQPVDLYVKYKNDISLWYYEMRDANLTPEEIEILEKHLKHKYGIADSQESVMLMVMDEKIGNCSVADANVLRKAIAKKNKDKLEEARVLLYTKGEEAGTSIHLLNYVWEVQIKRQIGYSFSDLHTTVYTIMGLQELNLFHNYNPLYWNTAVLTINSASGDDGEDLEEDEEKKNKSTDYGKVASAIGMMQQHNIKIGLPDINKAAFGFKPDIAENEIVYGLKGLVGIGDDVVSHITSNRPYISFEDFIVRMHDTAIIKKSQVVQLIKAGCFDSFGGRVEVMKKFINKIFSPKEKLNMQNFNMLVENNLIPEELRKYASLYKFRKYVTKKIHSTSDKKDKQYLLDSKSQPYFDEHFSDGSVVDYLRGYALISEKLFKKEYDKKMDGIKDWLTNPQTLEIVNRHLFNEEWNSNASGSTSKWEMDSLSFYYGEHELLGINNELYGISKFSELPEVVEIVDYFQFKEGARPKFKIDAIVGTVLDRDKNKHTVTLLTPDGVVTVKYFDGAFAQYNKQVSRAISQDKKEILEKSWFTRGNKLVIFGYRRGSQFVPKVYKDTKINGKKIDHTTMLITDVLIDGSFKKKSERTKI